MVRPATRANARDAVAFGYEPVDGEPLSHLDARVGGGLDQDPVQDGAAQRVGVSHVTHRRWRALQRERAEVKRVVADRRGTGGGDPRQQTPALQAGHTGLVDVVGRERVAREAGSVHHQDAVASAGEQHGCG